MIARKLAVWVTLGAVGWALLTLVFVMAYRVAP